jgi:hypothetical protein
VICGEVLSNESQNKLKRHLEAKTTTSLAKTGASLKGKNNK